MRTRMNTVNPWPESNLARLLTAEAFSGALRDMAT